MNFSVRKITNGYIVSVPDRANGINRETFFKDEATLGEGLPAMIVEIVANPPRRRGRNEEVWA